MPQVGMLHAQHNVQPRFTGLFFDDLRGRARTSESGYAAPDEASYRFHRSKYRSSAMVEAGDLMGQPTISEAGERPREVGAGLPQTGGLIRGPTAYQVHSQPYGYPFAQYAGGPVRRGNQFSPTYVTDPYTSQRRNVQIGPMGFGVGVNVYGEYTDNLLRNPDNIEEFIVGGTLGLSTDWPITRWQRISMNVGIGYEHYLINPDLNRRRGNGNLVLTPNSNFSFDMLLGEVYLVVYDSFGINDLRANPFGLDQNDYYYYFYNDLGIGANWQINSKWSMQANFNWSEQIALEDEFDFNDRTILSAGGALTYSPNDIVKLGLEAAASDISYRRDFQNDGYTYMYGAFFRIPITRNISMRAAAGLQHMRFDQGGGNGDRTDNLDDFYYNVAIQHQLNRYVSHSLAFGHEASLNNTSNFLTSDYINYGIGYAANRVRLSGSVFYANEPESGGILADNPDRFGFSLYGSYQLTEALNLGAGYSFSDVGSHSGLRSYDEQTYQIDLNYLLSRRWRAGLSYRYYTVGSRGTGFDYDQNRFLLNFYYNL